ncbi:MAG: bifunctional enoyl-CoA hydratase/phosphate acetyltransferase [Gammaproteobacteria bacterium]|nr:bifunctional enoyl-CoA hydratase/phosphate acetyltransferase [Gammaproteobacteria bacterium]
MNAITNVTFNEIALGQTLTVSRTVSRTDIEALAFVSGDIDENHAEQTENEPSSDRMPATEPVAAEAFFSYLLNRRLPGPGTTILAYDLAFQGRIVMGETYAATITVKEKRPEASVIVFDCRCTNPAGEMIASGTATVAAPTDRISHTELDTPEVIFRRTDVFARLIRDCADIPAVTCAVVHPCDTDSLLGALEAAQRKLIIPVLVGPEARIRAIARTAGADLSPYRIVDVEHSLAAAEKGVAMARAGEVEALMKGSLHTDELMAAVVPSATGLRTARRISHAFVMDVPTYPRVLLVTDAAINITPGLKDKVDIVQNAIDLAQVLGIREPRVALLSAVETVNPDIPSTIEAAALCKMADRKQITGGLLDGPLAFDNAINEQAATSKKIDSPVAGKADIVLVPNLEAGNMLAKQLQYLAGADAAGIVLGTRVPIVLTSRADSVRTRLASTAVMVLVAHARREAPPGQAM